MAAPVQATTATDGAEALPVPRAFVAATVHVYEFPVVSPFTVTDETAPVAKAVKLPFDDVHVAAYPVIVLPLLAPAAKDTRSEPFATFVALTAVGAAGDPTISAPEATDAAPAPAALIAFTVHV